MGIVVGDFGGRRLQFGLRGVAVIDIPVDLQVPDFQGERIRGDGESGRWMVLQWSLRNLKRPGTLSGGLNNR